MTPLEAADARNEMILKKLKTEYSKLKERLNRQMTEYLAAFRAQEKEMLKKVSIGEITKSEFVGWKRSIFRGSQWKSIVNAMADLIYETNKKANDQINDAIPENIAAGASEEAFETEKDLKRDCELAPMDTEDARAWMKEDPELYPEHKLNRKKDTDWNRKKVSNKVARMVGLNKNLDSIAESVSKATASENMNFFENLIRIITDGARNLGRTILNIFAKKKGVETLKQWMATLDFRTRDAHRELDGQAIPMEEPFVYHKDEIRFPHDPLAKPYLVCNCRCTYRTVRRDMTKEGDRRENIRDKDGEKQVIKYMTYEEWLKYKAKQMGGENRLQEAMKEQKRQQQREYYRRMKRKKKAGEK